MPLPFKTTNIHVKSLWLGEITITRKGRSLVVPRTVKKVYKSIWSRYGSYKIVKNWPSACSDIKLRRRYWLEDRWMEGFTCDNVWLGFVILFSLNLYNPYDWGLCNDIFQVWSWHPKLYWSINWRKFLVVIQVYGHIYWESRCPRYL